LPCTVSSAPSASRATKSASPSRCRWFYKPVEPENAPWRMFGRADRDRAENAFHANSRARAQHPPAVDLSALSLAAQPGAGPAPPTLLACARPGVGPAAFERLGPARRRGPRRVLLVARTVAARTRSAPEWPCAACSGRAAAVRVGRGGPGSLPAGAVAAAPPHCRLLGPGAYPSRSFAAGAWGLHVGFEGRHRAQATPPHCHAAGRRRSCMLRGARPPAMAAALRAARRRAGQGRAGC
jgi:hypothetical protein